ncbi:hypothetical protein B0I35DRAFT_479752 [Stachybotrys elegans]|uniref:Uncharacterized protein n=1 Tax=Stachybotrys elegans TaxID=80388 RepID=A0A8K0SMU3_9HYPO|nr:hypothetical protein B0I35DRAFT_479752 [Stachybotrys elegans]
MTPTMTRPKNSHNGEPCSTSNIIGASIGCGVTTCTVSEWNVNVTQLVNEYDTRDHNVLGAFQIVAKVIEIWFAFVAARLVYDLAMLLARNGDGLPLRYYTMNVEFADLLIILTPSFWTSALQDPLKSSVPNTHSRRRLIVAFAAIVAIISAVANLMGPAIAVLLLPTLGWRELPLPQKTTVFGGLAAFDSPSRAVVDSLNCEPAQLEEGDYTCLAAGSNTPLDALLVDASVLLQMASASQNSLLRQTFLTFSFNISDSLLRGDPTWAVSRQAIQAMSDDYGETVGLAALTETPMTPSEYRVFRNSIQTQLQRRAPALSTSVLCGDINLGFSVVEITEDRSVHCYNILNPDMSLEIFYPWPETAPLVSTMCIPTGSGWPGDTGGARFSAGAESSEAAFTVDIHSAYRAIYLDYSTIHCAQIPDGSDVAPLKARQSDCDWDALFEQEPPHELISESGSLLVTEYSIDGSLRGWCRSFAYLKFATYTLDMDFNRNPVSQVIIDGDKQIGSTDESIYVHPD